MYQSTLQKLGLKSEEIKTYTCLLELGMQPASIIGKKLNFKRTTVRGYLENLSKLGLVKFQLKDRTQYFYAEKPETSLKILEQQKEATMHKIEKNLDAFSSIIPELNSLIRFESNIPKVTFYEGIDELKRMYKDTLNAKSEILCLSSLEDILELFGEQYDTWYVKKRAKKQIHLRYLSKDTPTEREEKKKDKQLLRESRLLPAKTFGITNEINIYDDKISIITLKDERIGIIIESKEISQTMRIIFELIWSMGK